MCYSEADCIVHPYWTFTPRTSCERQTPSVSEKPKIICRNSLWLCQESILQAGVGRKSCCFCKSRSSTFRRWWFEKFHLFCMNLSPSLYKFFVKCVNYCMNLGPGKTCSRCCRVLFLWLDWTLITHNSMNTFLTASRTWRPVSSLSSFFLFRINSEENPEIGAVLAWTEALMSMCCAKPYGKGVCAPSPVIWCLPSPGTSQGESLGLPLLSLMSWSWHHSHA